MRTPAVRAAEVIPRSRRHGSRACCSVKGSGSTSSSWVASDSLVRAGSQMTHSSKRARKRPLDLGGVVCFPQAGDILWKTPVPERLAPFRPPRDEASAFLVAVVSGSPRMAPRARPIPGARKRSLEFRVARERSLGILPFFAEERVSRSWASSTMGGSRALWALPPPIPPDVRASDVQRPAALASHEAGRVVASPSSWSLQPARQRRHDERCRRGQAVGGRARRSMRLQKSTSGARREPKALGDGRRPGEVRAVVFDETASGSSPATGGDGDPASPDGRASAPWNADPPKAHVDVRGRVASSSGGSKSPAGGLARRSLRSRLRQDRSGPLA